MQKRGSRESFASPAKRLLCSPLVRRLTQKTHGAESPSTASEASCEAESEHSAAGYEADYEHSAASSSIHSDKTTPQQVWNGVCMISFNGF